MSAKYSIFDEILVTRGRANLIYLKMEPKELGDEFIIKLIYITLIPKSSNNFNGTSK